MEWPDWHVLHQNFYVKVEKLVLINLTESVLLKEYYPFLHIGIILISFSLCSLFLLNFYFLLELLNQPFLFISFLKRERKDLQ